MSVKTVVIFMIVGFTAGCGTAAVNQVADGTYLSLVPSSEQISQDVDGALPGGVNQLRIAEPVIWPGSFEASPVIIVKPRNVDEHGPDVSCRADEPCLLLSAGTDPAGAYADANNPELGENPIDAKLHLRRWTSQDRRTP